VYKSAVLLAQHKLHFLEKSQPTMQTLAH